MTFAVHGFDLFEFYRFLLAVLVCVYSTIRLITFIWRWHYAGADGWIGSALVRRYVIVLLLRLRFQRFVYEFLLIGGLATILFLLLRLHW